MNRAVSVSRTVTPKNKPQAHPSDGSVAYFDVDFKLRERLCVHAIEQF